MKNANNYITHKIAATLNCNIITQGAIVFAKIGAAIFLERKRIVESDCCIDNNMMAFIVDETLGNTQYFCYVMQCICFGSLVTATALPSLSSKFVGKIIKMFPPTLAEQKAIAEILSDMDTEIEALTKKLEKTRNIKKGMMHELLTGNIRLVKEEANHA